MQQIKIFVSSPGDADHERRRVERVIERLNGEFAGVTRLQAIRWETEFYRAHQTFQAQIPEAAQCDIVLAVFRGRIGTELPPDFAHMPDGNPYPSGTAYEVLTAIEARHKRELPDVFVFRSREPPVVRLDDPEAAHVQEQWQRLKKFFDTWFVAETGPFKAAFHTFGSTDEFEAQLERLLRRWVEDRVLHGRSVLWPLAIKGSPFRGLAAFGVRHAPVFFGRSRDIARAVDCWKDAAERGVPFLLVVGASGSGKSSLARAGLVPRLTTPGVVPAVDQWRVAVMRPSEIPEGPVRTLAARLLDGEQDIPDFDAGRPVALPELAGSDYRTATELSSLLAHADEAAIAPVLRVLDRIGEEARQRDGYERPVRADLILLVDQLEELFAADVSPAERTAFVALLRHMAESGRIWVLATLRADLYERFLAEPDLLALKSAGATYDLAAPGPAELAEIVRKPAEAANLVFERDPRTGDALDERLLREADRPDMLPLLQLALNRLFENRAATGDETRLTWAAYEELGGLAGIIEREAERALEGLGATEIAQLPRLLRQLVTAAPGAGTDQLLTTRSAPLAEVAADEAGRRLVEALVGARILLVSGEGESATVQLAHQRVLADWARARELIADDREFYRIRNEVEAQRRRWSNAGESRDLLLARGLPLAEAESVLGRFGDELPPGTRAFIAASGRRARARQRFAAAAAVVFAVLTVLASGAGLVAWQQRQHAVDAQRVAQAETARAERNLDAAKGAVSGLIFDIVQGLRDVEGLRGTTVRKILDRVAATIDRLARDEPGDFGLIGNRAEMLNEFSLIYAAAGDFDRARQSAEAAAGMFRDLAARFPDDPAWQNNLSVSLGRLSDAAMRMGDMAPARTAAEQAVATSRSLNEREPANPPRQQALSVVLERLGDLRMRTGEVDAALTAYQEGLTLRRQLAASDPENREWRRTISALTDRIGDIKARQGDSNDALATYEIGLTELRRVIEQDADDTGARRNLAVTLNKIGDIELNSGKPSDALPRYEEALAIARRLAALDPGNANWQRDLAIGLVKIGNVRLASGDRDAALAAFQESLRLRRRLADTASDNLEWQRDIAVALVKIGGVKFQAQDAATAKEDYREALAISRRLTAANPDNLELQRDVSVASSALGDTETTAGDKQAARAAYADAIEVMRRLTEREPSNALWQGDLALLLTKSALLSDGTSRADQLKEALAVVDALERDGKLIGPQTQWPEQLRHLLAQAR